MSHKNISSETPAIYLKNIMNRPEKILVGGITYDIILTNSENLGDDCGDCDIIKQKIRLNNKLSVEAKEYTLWHEIAHAWNSTWSEEQVDNIAQMISTTTNLNNLYKQGDNHGEKATK